MRFIRSEGLGILFLLPLCVGMVRSVSADGTATRRQLILTSQPAGAAVSVDGMDRGVTPVTLFDLKPGRHHVKYRMTGYVTRDRFVNTEGSPVLERNEILQEETGLLLVQTDPPGCDIQIDGTGRGRSPRLVTGLAVKDAHVIRLSRRGYAPRETTVTFDGRKPLVCEETLEAVFGEVQVSVEPEDARISVDGEDVGTGSRTVPELEPGDHVVRVEREGYAAQERKLTVVRGQRIAETFALVSQMGRIDVRTDPIGAEVLLDGKSIGVTRTSNIGVEFSDALSVGNLSEGEHLLVVRKEGYAEAVRRPVAENAKTLTASIRLKRLFVPDVEIVTVRGSYRGVLVSDTATSVEIEVQLGINRTFPRDEIVSMKKIGEKP